MDYPDQSSSFESPSSALDFGSAVAFWSIDSYELIRCTLGFASLIEIPLEVLENGFSAVRLDASGVLACFQPSAYSFTEIRHFNLATGSSKIKNVNIAMFTTNDTIIWRVFTGHLPSVTSSPESPVSVPSSPGGSPGSEENSGAKPSITNASITNEWEMVKVKNRGRKPWQQKVTKFTFKKVGTFRRPKGEIPP
jgi:hypothetical protein